MHYNHKGVMIGTAEITFNDKISAQKAIQTYDGVPLDKYKMSLTLVQRHSPKTVYTRLGSKQNGSKFYRQGAYINGHWFHVIVSNINTEQVLNES